MFNTNFCFTPGKLTTILDGQAGSSGKGKLGSFITEHASNWHFACTTASPNAGHWVVLDDGRRFFYQTLNSCAYNHEKFEKLYIGPGATIEPAAFWRELEENGIPRNKIGISPVTSILQDIDGGYERGTHDFSGNYHGAGTPQQISGGPLAATGSTAHGCGANRARRVLRRKEAKYARDIPEFKEFLCDVPGEIMRRLDGGQSGLLEVAQGFQLSYMLPEFFPFTTSRNCTVSAGLDDMMLPPVYAGPVVINLRTYPIRINSNKYIEKSTGKHLTMDEYQAMKLKHEHAWRANNPHPVDAGNVQGPELPYRVVEGNSGPGYDDQHEISWDDVTAWSGSPAPISEMTSVTKLPRRVFTFSRKNLESAIRHNRTPHPTYLSVNFMNYVDASITGARAAASDINGARLPEKVVSWIRDNLTHHSHALRFIGTGSRTDDMVAVTPLA